MSRPLLRSSLCEELLPLKILDSYQLAGALANWWSDHYDDLKILDYRGFTAVINMWGVDAPSSPEHVLNVLGDDLRSHIRHLVAMERQALVDTYRTLGDRYESSLMELEDQRTEMATRLEARLNDLGYRQRN
jgi:type I restriction enzyme M protein